MNYGINTVYNIYMCVCVSSFRCGMNGTCFPLPWQVPLPSWEVTLPDSRLSNGEQRELISMDWKSRKKLENMAFTGTCEGFLYFFRHRKF